MQAERTPLTDEDVVLWTGRARALLAEADSHIEDQNGDDALAAISAADMALRIAYGEADPRELEGYPFPGEEQEYVGPPCTCPPELVKRGGWSSKCAYWGHRA